MKLENVIDELEQYNTSENRFVLIEVKDKDGYYDYFTPLKIRKVDDNIIIPIEIEEEGT